MGIQDGDSAGFSAYKKGWKTRDDSYAFSNAIRLKRILDYRKFSEFLPKCILFLQNMFLNKAIRFRKIPKNHNILSENESSRSWIAFVDKILFFKKNLQFFTKFDQVPACAYCKKQYSILNHFLKKELA